jgi:hypothetical protein
MADLLDIFLFGYINGFSIPAEILSEYSEEVSAPVENRPFPPAMVSTHVENLIRLLKGKILLL